MRERGTVAAAAWDADTAAFQAIHGKPAPYVPPRPAGGCDTCGAERGYNSRLCPAHTPRGMLARVQPRAEGGDDTRRWVRYRGALAYSTGYASTPLADPQYLIASADAIDAEAARRNALLNHGFVGLPNEPDDDGGFGFRHD